MNSWHYTHEGNKYGPINDDELLSLVAEGFIHPDDKLWQKGMYGWAVAKSINGLTFPPNKSLAVVSIKKWLLTICYDLCLPVVPVIVKHGGNGYAGRFFGEHSVTQDASGWVGMNINGFMIGGPVGGQVHEHTSYHIEIYVIAGYGEQEYLHTLAHELRHAWQFFNGIAATERDCNDYADSVLTRFDKPICGEYLGLIDEQDHKLAAARNNRIYQEESGGNQIVVFLSLALLAGFIQFMIYQGTDWTNDDVDRQSFHAKWMWLVGCFYVAFVFSLLRSFLSKLG